MSGRGDWNSVTHSGFRRGRVHGAAQSGGLLERAGAPATSQRQLEEERCWLRGVSFQGGGQGARLPQAPQGAGPAGPQLRQLQPWSLSALTWSAAVPGPCAPGQPAARRRRGERRAESGRAQHRHWAAGDRGVPGSSFTPDAFPSLRPPPCRAVGRGMRHG